MSGSKIVQEELEPQLNSNCYLHNVLAVRTTDKILIFNCIVTLSTQFNVISIITIILNVFDIFDESRWYILTMFCIIYFDILYILYLLCFMFYTPTTLLLFLHTLYIYTTITMNLYNFLCTPVQGRRCTSGSAWSNSCACRTSCPSPRPTRSYKSPTLCCKSSYYPVLLLL